MYSSYTNRNELCQDVHENNITVNILALIWCSVRSKRLRSHLVLTSTPCPVVSKRLQLLHSSHCFPTAALLRDLIYKHSWNKESDTRFSNSDFWGHFEFLYENSRRYSQPCVYRRCQAQTRLFLMQWSNLTSVLRNWNRIRMLLGLQDPNPFVRSMDQEAPPSS